MASKFELPVNWLETILILESSSLATDLIEAELKVELDIVKSLAYCFKLPFEKVHASTVTSEYVTRSALLKFTPARLACVALSIIKPSQQSISLLKVTHVPTETDPLITTALPVSVPIDLLVPLIWQLFPITREALSLIISLLPRPRNSPEFCCISRDPVTLTVKLSSMLNVLPDGIE